MSNAKKFYSQDARGVLCVRASDYDALSQRCRELEVENESLACNLRGKHATTGATYQHLVSERDTLRAEVERLKEALGDLDNRHSNNCHYMAQFKQRIQKLLGTEEDNWFALLDVLEAEKKGPSGNQQ